LTYITKRYICIISYKPIAKRIKLFDKYLGHIKWVNTALSIQVIISVVQIVAFYIQMRYELLFYPVITIVLCIISFLLYNFKDKVQSLIFIGIAFPLFFAIRPLLLGPVWSVTIAYLVFPIVFTFNLKTGRRQMLLVYFYFSILALINTVGNIYTTIIGMPINVFSELLFFICAFILVQYVLISFKNEVLSLAQKASFTTNYLENVLSVAPIMMYTLDTHFNFKIVNAAYLDGTGYKTRADIIGKSKQEIFNLKRYRNMDLSLDEDFQILNGNKDKFSGTRHLYMSHSKKMKWVSYNKVPTKDDNGSITGLLCVMHDVTDIVESRNELDRKNEELKHYIDSNLQLESFAFLASHDLKTPLRTISSFSQLLKDRANRKLSDEEKQYLDFIISGSQSMDRLIEDLLEYSTLNRSEFSTSKIIVSELIDAVKQDLNITLINENVKIQLVNDDVAYVDGNFTLLKQLFNNLISNAIKYKKLDFDPIIKISCKSLKGAIQFMVEDNGIGIEQKYFDRIFLLLQRLHTSSVYEGTGIGLAICKQIVEKHGGKIWVNSEPNVGSCFYFTLESKFANSKLNHSIDEIPVLVNSQLFVSR